MKRSGPFLLLLVFFLVAGLAQPAFAIYKWVDDKGLLHITDYPPPSKEPAPEPVTPKPAAPASAPTPSVAPAASAAPTLPKTSPSMTAAATRPSTTAAAAATKPSGTAVAAPAPAPSPVPAPSPAMPAAPRQQMPLSPEGIKALAGGFLMVFVLVGLAFYVYFSLCMYLIAKKLNVAEAWMSWVPILNLWPFLTSAGKPCWWVILLFIPFVNIIVIIYLWMCICENLGRNKWLGLLILVPIVSLVLPGILAFSRNE